MPKIGVDAHLFTVLNVKSVHRNMCTELNLWPDLDLSRYFKSMGDIDASRLDIQNAASHVSLRYLIRR